LKKEKMWKRSFRAKFSSKTESGRSKMKLSCQTCSKTELWKWSLCARPPSKAESGRCENEAFVSCGGGGCASCGDNSLRKYINIREFHYYFIPAFNPEIFGGGGTKFLRNISPDHMKYTSPPHMFLGFLKEVRGGPPDASF
jgi:hypothetical protein